MNPPSEDDLIEIFAHARRCHREEAPAWRAELLERPMRRPRPVLRWALVTTSVVVLAVVFTQLPQHEPRLSEALPPLLDSPPGELFASVEPALLSFEAPSDFLLTSQLNPSRP